MITTVSVLGHCRSTMVKGMLNIINSSNMQENYVQIIHTLNESSTMYLFCFAALISSLFLFLFSYLMY